MHKPPYKVGDIVSFKYDRKSTEDDYVVVLLEITCTGKEYLCRVLFLKSPGSSPVIGSFYLYEDCGAYIILGRL